MKKRVLLLKIIAGVMAIASAACFAMPAVVKWALLHNSHNVTISENENGSVSSIGVIGGADGPTAIFIATKSGRGFPINDSPPVVGGFLAAGAVALWLWAKKLSRKKQG